MANEPDLSKLTEEERAILKEDDASLDDADIETDRVDEDEADDDDEEDEEARKAAEEAAAKKADEEEEEEVDLRRDPAPLIGTEEPKDIEERLTALAEEKAALVQKFDDGEITAREYSDGLEAISDKRNDIQWEKRKAEIGREAHERAITDAWDRDVAEFMSTTAKKIAEKGEPALLAFDSYVKKVTGDPKNARMSNRAQLEKAHKAFLADFDGFGTAPKPNPKEKDGGDPPKPAAKKERVIPPTLARVPAADLEDIDEGKFAALDRLADTDPLAYQKRIARMTPSEREEYGI